MAFLSDSASLSLSGRTELDTASRVTATLRVEPSTAVEIGDPHPDAALAARGRVATASFWIFDEPPGAGPGGGHARFDSLDALLRRFAPLADLLAQLSEHYELAVWVAATTDDPRAEFALHREILVALARMRVTLHQDIRLVRPA